MEPAAENTKIKIKIILNSCGWSRFHHRLGGSTNILLLQPQEEQTHTSCSHTWFIHTPGVCVCVRALHAYRMTAVKATAAVAPEQRCWCGLDSPQPPRGGSDLGLSPHLHQEELQWEQRGGTRAGVCADTSTPE